MEEVAMQEAKQGETAAQESDDRCGVGGRVFGGGKASFAATREHGYWFQNRVNYRTYKKGH